MAAIAMPDIDRRKLERIRDRLTPLTAMDLSDIDLPELDQIGRQIGRQAERARDRVTGRSRRSIWPRLALGLGLLALVGVAIAIFGSSRRSPWSMTGDDTDEGLERPFDTPPADLAATTLHAPSGLSDVTEMDAPEPDTASVGTGLSAAEASLMSSDPNEETLS
jgi:hypothetical protein